MEHPNTAWTDPMPRGARIAGWVYFPIHAVVLPLTLGMLLLAVLGEQPLDFFMRIGDETDGYVMVRGSYEIQ